jgi:hypothetical protein
MVGLGWFVLGLVEAGLVWISLNYGRLEASHLRTHRRENLKSYLR